VSELDRILNFASNDQKNKILNTLFYFYIIYTEKLRWFKDE